MTNKRQEAIRNPWVDDPSIQPRVHRRFRAILGGVTLAVAIVLVTITLATQVTYGTGVWWTHPATLHWCGRTYRRGRVEIVRRSEITLGSLPGTGAFPLKRIGRLPPLVGWPVIGPFVEYDGDLVGMDRT